MRFFITALLFIVLLLWSSGCVNEGRAEGDMVILVRSDSEFDPNVYSLAGGRHLSIELSNKLYENVLFTEDNISADVVSHHISPVAALSINLDENPKREQLNCSNTYIRKKGPTLNLEIDCGNEIAEQGRVYEVRILLAGTILQDSLSASAFNSCENTSVNFQDCRGIVTFVASRR